MINSLYDIENLRAQVDKMTADEVIAEIQELPLPANVRADAIIRIKGREEPPNRVLRDIWVTLQRAYSN